MTSATIVTTARADDAHSRPDARGPRGAALRRRLAAALVLAAAVLASGAGVREGVEWKRLLHPRMDLPPDFPASLEIVPCTHALNRLSSRPFACGPLQIARFRFERSSAGRLSRRHGLVPPPETVYSFTAELAGREAWEVYCHRAEAPPAHAPGDGGGPPVAPANVVVALQCKLLELATGVKWSLDLRTEVGLLAPAPGSGSSGALAHGDTRYAVLESHKICGVGVSSALPIGYLLSCDGCWVGAVEAGATLAVRLDASVERDPLLAASAAMMLASTVAFRNSSGWF